MQKNALMSFPMLAGTLIIVVLVIIPAVIVGALLANKAPLFEPPGVMTRLGLYLRTNVAETGPEPVLPELAPLLLHADASTAMHTLAQVVRELGWHPVSVDEKGAQMRAVVVSPVLRFSDDIHLRLLARSAERVELMVRSSSRVGRGDLGANAHHIMILRDALRRRGLLTADGG